MKNVEDLYPLSPVQQGMLFHALLAPTAGMYLEQKICTLEGALDPAAFQCAWQRVVERHPALRTAFLAQGLEQPLQVVRKVVKVPWHEADWRALPPAAQQAQLEAYVQADRACGMDLAKAPLMRMALFRTGEETHEFVWMHHHILIDGWSLPLLLKEVFAFYEALRQGRELTLLRSRPYREYIAWLQKQDLTKAEAFWRAELRGFTKPTPLLARDQQEASAPHAAHQEEIYGEQQVIVPEAETAALQALARQHQLTLNTVVQGAWGLLLRHLSGEQDVVFGATVSGRPTDIPGVEAIVGLFINTLPVRVTICPEAHLLDWLKTLQRRQVEARQYDYSPLAQVQSWSEVPRGRPLFESFLVYDNYPEESGGQGQASTLRIRNLRARERGNYQLVIKVRVAPGAGMILGTLHDTRLFSEATITGLLESLKMLLHWMTANPTTRLDAIETMLIEAERKEKMIKTKKRKEVNLANFMNVKPTAVAVSPSELVEKRYLNDEHYPLIMQPVVEDVDLADWARGNRALLEQELLHHGAILFRGFGIHTVAAFERFAGAVADDLFGEYGDLPPEDGKVYKSTPYPEDKTILFHNESSHMHTWPTKQFFCCLKVASEQGETPLVDCRKVYQRLDPAIVRNFEQKQLMYVRNFIEGLDVSWQDFFRTTDKSKVEAYCRTNGINCEWTANNRLRLSHVGPGVIQHPKTGEKSFFNQVQLHHIYFLDPELRQSLAALFAPEEYPRNVFYGDGTPIRDAVMEEILRVYWDTSVALPWQAGDVIMVDNMITAHARNPYKGERKIIVALAELTGIDELARQGA